jgi:hypothetical protein
MSSFRYTEPSGTRTKNPSVSAIVHDILRRGEEFWQDSANGWGELEYGRQLKVVCTALIFTKKDGVGFHAKYVEFQRKGSVGIFESYTWDGSDDEQAITLPVGGQRTTFPRFMFISAAKMAMIVKDFFDKGKRSKRCKWLTPHDIDGKWIR